MRTCEQGKHSLRVLVAAERRFECSCHAIGEVEAGEDIAPELYLGFWYLIVLEEGDLLVGCLSRAAAMVAAATQQEGCRNYESKIRL